DREREERKQIKGRPTIAFIEDTVNPPEGIVNVNEDDFIIPEDEVGEEGRGFRRYVKMDKNKFSATDEFKPWLTDIDYIATLSCKYAEMVRLVRDEPGNAFIYFPYVVGSGLITMALCLEGMGFVRYEGNNSIFVSSDDKKGKTVCATSSTHTSRKVNPNFKSYKQGGPRRYAILQGGVNSDNILEAMNSYENRHGDYIKVLLSSPVGKEGINVNNVLQIHLAGGEWNQSSIYQEISRGIRATSHEDLLNEERERLIKLGEDPSTATVDVNIYKHVAITSDDERSSIDLQMYNMAEFKDRIIKRVLRMMKQCAVGCQIHYNRNIHPEDVDGSAACDYDLCQYQCVDPPPDFVDYSTYDVLYTGEKVNEITSLLRNIYREQNSLSINQITKLLPQYRYKYILLTLENLITNKIPITDRFGYNSYIREDRGTFYLDRTYPDGNIAEYDMSYYTNGLIAIEQSTVNDVLVQMETYKTRDRISYLEKLDPEDPLFNQKLDELSVEAKAILVEESILNTLSGNNTQFYDAIINKYKNFIFTIHDPITELNKLYQTKATTKPKRGPKAKSDIVRRVKKVKPDNLDIVFDTNTELVYLHTIYSLIMGKTRYAVVARINKGEGRTRIIKPSEIENGWRDLNQDEYHVYNKYIQLEIMNRFKVYEDKMIYGIIYPDKVLRIRNKLTEDPKAMVDYRSQKRGEVCKSLSLPELIDVMWYIGAPEPTDAFPDFKSSQRNLLISNIMRHTNDKTKEDLE
ncbi:MAG: helicase C-terminal domain-containing protein, partial [Candidatus Nitrosocosmicus sp.]|nr:helicase C-terminal domain-containing protein [Candidatus Nitrosocosmicus sp.]